MTVLTPTSDPSQEALPVKSVSRSLDRVEATFDDDTLVADAGLILPATLVVRLGLEQLINATVASMLVGGCHIDHADRLRAGATAQVLPFRVMAPSTLGTFLRSFTFGHIRQLDAVIAEAIRRAWHLGVGPGESPATIDLDSTICEVHGKQKQGAAYGYTRAFGYHPILATRAGTGEVLHARLRNGSSQRGHVRFVEELIARVRRAGATGLLTVRGDSGFWSYKLIDTLHRLGVRWSITVPISKDIRARIDAIDESAWTTIRYPDGGEAEVAETTLIAGKSKRLNEVRLIVRRTRLTDPAQAQLWPDWRHHAFITDVDLDPVAVDEFHRDHATVELAIRDLKDGAGLEHCPSGRFFANAAWLGCAVLAHNLTRWTARLGRLHPDDQLTVARTIRTRVLALPGRLVNLRGRRVLRLPSRWPWQTAFTSALGHLRALPMLS
jgi:hypothetical protein